MDAEDRETGTIDKALDALDDVIDTLDNVVIDEEGQGINSVPSL